MALVNFVYAATASAAQKAAFNADTLYFIGDEKTIYKGTVPYTGGADLVAEDLVELKGWIGTLPVTGDYTDLIDYIDKNVAAAQAAGEQAAADLDAELADVAKSGAAADVSIADAGGLITATTVEGALQELAEAVADTEEAGAVTVESPASASYAAVYEIYQGLTGEEDAAAKAAKKVGTINVPKDMVLSSGTVGTVTTADQPYAGAVVGDKYLDLVLANAQNDHIYVPASDLVDVYNGSGTAGTSEVIISVDNSTNTISGTIGKVAATKVIYQAASGGDPEVTVAGAIADLQDQIDNIDVADQIEAAIGELDAEVSIADTTGTNPLNITITEVDGVLTGVTGSIDANTFDAYGTAAAAIEALDSTVSIVDSDNTNPLNITITEANGMLTGVTGSIDANTFDTYGAAAAVVGQSTDAANAATVYGAKAYADSLLTWGSLA